MNEHRKIEPLTEIAYVVQLDALNRDLRLAKAQNEQAQLDLITGTIDEAAAALSTEKIKSLEGRKAALEAAWRAAERIADAQAVDEDKEARVAAFNVARERVSKRDEDYRAWVEGVRALAPLRAAFLKSSAAIIAAASPHRRAFAEDATQAMHAFGDFVKTVHDNSKELTLIQEEGQAGLTDFGSNFKTLSLDTVTESRKRDLIRHLWCLVDQDD